MQTRAPPMPIVGHDRGPSAEVVTLRLFVGFTPSCVFSPDSPRYLSFYSLTLSDNTYSL